MQVGRERSRSLTTPLQTTAFQAAELKQFVAEKNIDRVVCPKVTSTGMIVVTKWPPENVGYKPVSIKLF